MKKILVIGPPGAGKSTFSRKLHTYTNIPLYYLDMIHHLPDRTFVSDEQFYNELNNIIIKDKWIIDGNYISSMEIRLKHADTVFFLDYPVELCLQSIKDRVGTKREDMPWIEEELDLEFYEYVKQFPNKQIPRIYELLNNYHNDLYIFKDRKEADEYINNLSSLNAS